MLLVHTIVKKSNIPNAGLGLFAAEDISKDRVVWKFVDGFDQVFSDEQLEILPDIAKDFIKLYAFRSIWGDSKGLWILSSDNDKYQNSCEVNKNIGEQLNSSTFTDDIIALRDIENGEELLSLYSEWDDNDINNFK
jgi:uncharacterized protein